MFHFYFLQDVTITLMSSKSTTSYKISVEVICFNEFVPHETPLQQSIYWLASSLWLKKKKKINNDNLILFAELHFITQNNSRIYTHAGLKFMVIFFTIMII